jgi:hypothetical protein
MVWLRDFFNSPTGKVIVFVGISLVVGISLWLNLMPDGQSSLAADSRQRVFICTETLKSFVAEIRVGEPPIAKSPFSGKDTGVPAELCYWTREGTIKEEPTAVLMNSRIGKPEPTFCQDCGRLVVGHNPIPAEGSKPPPLKSEYKDRSEGERTR